MPASFSLPIRPLIMAAGRGQRYDPRRRGTLTTLAISVGVPLALGQVVGLWSARDIALWYPRLRKPEWTPPIAAFGPIWGVLYTAMGLAAHRVWAAGAPNTVLGSYAVQLVLNLCWQPLVWRIVHIFFYRQLRTDLNPTIHSILVIINLHH